MRSAKLGCVRGESARGDEDAAAGLGSLQRADEALDVRPADDFVGVALGLHVDDVEAERVELDQAVQPAVTRAAEVLGQPAVAYPAEQLWDHAL